MASNRSVQIESRCMSEHWDDCVPVEIVMGTHMKRTHMQVYDSSDYTYLCGANSYVLWLY